MDLSVHDVTRLLNVSEKTIYRWISQGSLPTYRINHQYRFNRAELLQWALNQKVSLSPEVLREDAGESGPLPSLSEAIESGGIHYRVAGKDKAGILRAVVDLLRLPEDPDRAFLHQVLLAREAMGSTGVGDGVAIPHARNPIILNVRHPVVMLCFLEAPVDFGAVDGQPVRTLFTLITPTVRSHLHLLSRLAFMLRDAQFKELLDRPALRDELLEALRLREDALRPPAPGGAGA